MKIVKKYIFWSVFITVLIGLSGCKPAKYKVDAGEDQIVHVLDVVTLDGSVIFEKKVKIDELIYYWSFTSVPDGSVAVLSDPSILNPTFVADKIGNYNLTLIVTDGKNQSATDSVTITAISEAPKANAGEDINTTQGSSFIFDGSGSSDDVGIVKYEWFEEGIKLGEGEMLEFNATDLGIGEHNITLVTTDTDDSDDSDNILVIVFQAVKKTGQTTIYQTYDDGYYQKGVLPSYTRDDSTNIVVDHITGLMWQDDVAAGTLTMPWSEAITYCENLSLGDYTDWRLPNMKELYGIIDISTAFPAINTTAFNNVAPWGQDVFNPTSRYWTLTPLESNTLYAWYIFFDEGHNYSMSKTTPAYVRCVRDSQ